MLEVCRGEEATVATGLILLVFIGFLVAFALARVRRRMGMGMPWRLWVTVTTAVIVLAFALWAISTKR